MPTHPPLTGDAIGVLIVEDEPILLLDTSEVFTAAGMVAFEAHNADEALGILSLREDIRVLISDLDMPLGEVSGLNFIQTVAIRWPRIGILVLSGTHAPKAGNLPIGVRFLPKPADARRLVSAAFAVVSRQTGSI